MTPVSEANTGVNGYFILAIIAIVLSFLTMFVSNKLNKNTKKTPNSNNGKMMMFIMPLIMGLFALLYTSIFALYIIFGQLIQLALLPLQTLIVNKLEQRSEAKKKKKTEVIVDYRRK